MTEPTIRAFAPGRVNLIGEHTDYNGGLALPIAITHGVTAEATVIGEPVIDVTALDIRRRDRFPLHAPQPTRGWRAFVRGVAAELQRDGVQLPGVRLKVGGDLPRGSGLSSSAAFAVSICMALLAAANVRWDDRLRIARLCQRVENEWAGAHTGLLDQLASLFGAAEHAVLIDFRSLEHELLPLRLGGCRLVTIDSGERHGNARSGYNRRREECVEAAHRMGKESLRDAQIQDLHLLPDVLERRARHVIGENGRVEQAAAALQSGDMQRLGRLLDASHASLRDDYEVSTDAIEQTVLQLKRLGALGARLIGGGFGGSVLALLPPDCEVPQRATVVSAGAGARLLPVR